MKILLVDDESDFLEQTKIFLEKEDERLTIEVTTSTKSALKFLEKNNYDAIVSDYQMPEMNGLEFLEIIREEKNSDIPFIIFTGRGREEVAMQALNIGANRYLQKGGDPRSQYGVLAQTIIQEVEHGRAEERRDFFRTSASRAPEAIFVSDQNANILYANEQASENLGYPIKELEEKKIFDLDPNFSSKDWKKHWQKTRKKERTKIESEHIRKDGTKFPVELLINHINHRGKEYHFTFTRDITQKKEENKKFKDFFEAIPDAVAVLNGNLVIEDINEAASRWTGLDKDEMVGKNIMELNIIGEEDKNRLLEHREELDDETGLFITIDYKHVSGETRPTELHIVRAEIGGQEKIIAVDRDIKKIKELRKREDFLHSLLRHDVMNKTQIVNGYLKLTEDYDLPKEVKDYISKARKASQNGIEIIKKVRTLKGIGKENLEEISLSVVIWTITTNEKPKALEKGVEIEVEPHNCKIKGGKLLEELFSNLVKNSIQHADCDKIRISYEELGDEIIAKVEDDGKGIPDEDKDKIFKKGYKMGETGGSGLGLFLVKEIAESYGGSVEVKDSELDGARFDVHLKKV